MKIVEVSRITDIPSEIIWNEMKHFDRVLNWVPGGSESTISVKGKGVGGFFAAAVAFAIGKITLGLRSEIGRASCRERV